MADLAGYRPHTPWHTWCKGHYCLVFQSSKPLAEQAAHISQIGQIAVWFYLCMWERVRFSAMYCLP